MRMRMHMYMHGVQLVGVLVVDGLRVRVEVGVGVAVALQPPDQRHVRLRQHHIHPVEVVAQLCNAMHMPNT